MSNEVLSLFIKHSPIHAYIKTVTPTESRVMQASENYQDMIGIPGSEMVGKTMEELFPAEFAAKMNADDWAVVSNGSVLKLDEDLNGRNYTTIKFPIFQGDKNLLAGYTIDITERKRAEQKIATALEEKEILLRELYHRTKNNMQVILAMLSLESARSSNEEMKTSYKEIANRIQAMALVHQKLYQSQNLTHINLQEYLQELAELLLHSFRLTSEKISLRCDIEPVDVLIDTAMPCGLVVTELISNSLKYAFPGGSERRDQPAAYQEGSRRSSCAVRITELASRPISIFSNLKSYGLRSVFALVEHQLQGQVSFTSDQGLACHIRFSDTFYAPRVDS